MNSLQQGLLMDSMFMSKFFPQTYSWCLLKCNICGKSDANRLAILAHQHLLDILCDPISIVQHLQNLQHC